MIDEAWNYAQQSVLGSCIIDSRAVGLVLFDLSDDDFQGINRTIFSIIREKYTTGKPVDPVSVVDALGGGVEYRKYIIELMDITPTAANVKTYAGICRERSKVNRYRELGEQLAGVESAKDAAEILPMLRGQGARHVFPHRPSWILSIRTSPHLGNDAHGFKEKR